MTSLLAIGINYKTAPVSLRERIIFSFNTLDKTINSLLKQPLVYCGVVLSTCNRTELYLSVEAKDDLCKKIAHWLCDYNDLPLSDFYNSFYWYFGEKAVSHLMRVASGMDSLVIGEPQILGQVKKAFDESRKWNNLSVDLNRLFQRAFSVAKRVRTKTEIGSHSISIAFAVCTLARRLFQSLTELTVLLVGAGDTIKLVARYLSEHKYKVKRLLIANRTYDRASLLAKEIGADVINFIEINNQLSSVDIVITSTSSMLPIINKDMVANALKRRYCKPVLLVDIAVPRDIESNVNQLSGVYLYTLDDLQIIIEKNLVYRKHAAQLAEDIIKQESLDFMDWWRSRSALKMIRDYRFQANSLREKLESKAIAALRLGVDPEQVVKDMAYKLTNRLIHTPTKSLQQAAKEGELERLQILRDSLGLDTAY